MSLPTERIYGPCECGEMVRESAFRAGTHGGIGYPGHRLPMAVAAGIVPILDRRHKDRRAVQPSPDTGLDAARVVGEGYEVRTWVSHQPSGVVVLSGHPQLGGRYCTTDGGDWPCAAVRSALALRLSDTDP